MARARDFKRRIKSVKQTAQITHTMELVATAKAKVCQNRLERLRPYIATLADVASSLGAAGELRHPLLGTAERKAAGRVLLLAVTANRGLCGGYNGQVQRLTQSRLAEHRAAGREALLHVSGKKGLQYFRYVKAQVAGSYMQFDDRPDFAAAAALADEFMRAYVGGEFDAVEVAHYHYESAGRQVPLVTTLLPVSPHQRHRSGAARPVDFLFEPDPRAILDSVLPLAVQSALYHIFQEAATSEQVARRTAMKSASDNAREMVRRLTQSYNRARQAQITQELAEIMGGAEALA